MNRIMQRVVANSTSLSKKKKIAAWDNSTGPKTGSSSYPGQDDTILWKLMQLEPYITYDNILHALRARSRMEHELLREDLRDYFIRLYKESIQQMNTIQQYDDKNAKEVTRTSIEIKPENIAVDVDDKYADEDMNRLFNAISALRQQMNQQDDKDTVKYKQIKTLELQNVRDKRNALESQLEQIDELYAYIRDTKEVQSYSTSGEKIKIAEMSPEEMEARNDIKEKLMQKAQMFANNIIELKAEIQKLNIKLEQAKENKKARKNKKKKKEFRAKILEIKEKIEINNKKLLEQLKKQDEYTYRALSILINDEKQTKSELNFLRLKREQIRRLCLFLTNKLRNIKRELENITPVKENQFAEEYDNYAINDNSDMTFHDKIKNIQQEKNKVLEEQNNPETPQSERALLQVKIQNYDKQIDNIHKLIIQRKNENIFNLITKLLDTNLYKQYSPYRAAYDLIRQECENRVVDDDDDNILTAPKAGFRSKIFQQALNMLANSSPTVYRTIMDDIFKAISRYPNFNIDLNRTHDIHIISYVPVEAGTGNYIYNEETGKYEESDEGDFVKSDRLITPQALKERQQANIKVFTYTAVKNGTGDYIYDETTNEYKPDSNGNYIRTEQSLDSNLIRQLADSNRYVKRYSPASKGKGYYKYNESTGKYEPSYEKTEDGRIIPTGDFDQYIQDTKAIQATNKADNDAFTVNNRLREFANIFIHDQFRNRKGYIDPIIIAFRRIKTRENRIEGNPINLVKRLVSQYAKYIQMLDDANKNSNQKILSPDWERDLELLCSKYLYNNLDKSVVEQIEKFVVDYLASIRFRDENKNVSTIKDKQEKKEIMDVTVKKIDKSHPLAFTNEYDQRMYKNQFLQIDPIAIVWAKFVVDYDIQRQKYKQIMENESVQLKPINIKLPNGKTMSMPGGDIKLEKLGYILTTLEDEITRAINESAIKTVSSGLMAWEEGSELERDCLKFIQNTLDMDISYLETLNIREKQRYFKEAKLAGEKEKYQHLLRQQYEIVTKTLQKIRDNRKQTQSLMIKMLNKFINLVKEYGEKCENVLKNDTDHVVSKLIAPQKTWQPALIAIVNKLNEYIADSKYINFNPAYFVDILENEITSYTGAKKKYNQVREDDLKNIGSMDIAIYLSKYSK